MGPRWIDMMDWRVFFSGLLFWLLKLALVRKFEESVNAFYKTGGTWEKHVIKSISI